MPFGQGLCHGEGFAHHGAVGQAQHRNKGGRGKGRKILGHPAGIEAHHMGAEGQAEFFQHEPAAHGPA